MDVDRLKQAFLTVMIPIAELVSEPQPVNSVVLVSTHLQNFFDA
jgi:hypothetical protein